MNDERNRIIVKLTATVAIGDAPAFWDAVNASEHSDISLIAAQFVMADELPNGVEFIERTAAIQGFERTRERQP